MKVMKTNIGEAEGFCMVSRPYKTDLLVGIKFSKLSTVLNRTVCEGVFDHPKQWQSSTSNISSYDVRLRSNI